MSRYIIVSPQYKYVRISDYRPRNRIVVPCNRAKMKKEVELVKTVQSILHANKKREVARDPEQRHNPDDMLGYASNGVKVKFSLRDPDPWLVALACVMWEGLIQGLTWDVIKLSVKDNPGQTANAATCSQARQLCGEEE